MKSRWLWVLGAVVLVAGASSGVVLATSGSGLTTTTLAQATSVDDLDLRGQALTTTTGPDGRTHPNGVWLAWIKTHGLSDLYVIDNKIAPGGTTGWHSHAGPSLIFVVNGEVTNYESDAPGCAGVTYHQGQSFVDEGGDHAHTLKNEGTAVAETIAVQFLPQGVGRRIDVTTVPTGCPA